MRTVILRAMRHAVYVLAALGAAAPTAFANARIVIVNGNLPGVGFNDPTPMVPVGGNSGTTLGQQRLIAFQHAADIWGAVLDSPVEIRVLATFEALGCTPTAAVLGSAGPRYIFSDLDFGKVGAFPGPVLPNVWHHSALADKRAGTEVNPGPDVEFPVVVPAPDIRARFNANIGQPTCLATTTWYYGLDTNQAANQINLVTVLLHEFAHGLGFSQFANLDSGMRVLGLGDVYGANLLDTSTFKRWNDMTDAERAASAINARRVVWDGAEVYAATPDVLTPGPPVLAVHTPASIAGLYDVGAASFGPEVSVAGLSGQVVQALDAADAAGPATSDACTALTNATAVAGNIALVDRGSCGFIVKVKNAQLAGAIAVIVADNAAGGPPGGLGGIDPTITIPSVRITLADGNTIKAQLASGVTATLGIDVTRLSGADAQRRIYINATNPVQPGSSISHWDSLTAPNQLMEPAINANLTHSVQPPQDLTLALMRDIGWFPDADNDGYADDQDACDASDLSTTLLIQGKNSLVTNVLFTSGCTMADYIADAASDAVDHGSFVSELALLTNAWRDGGFISVAEMWRLQRLGALSSVGR